MKVEEFLSTVAHEIVSSCNAANLLPSPSIAQAIIESKYGTSQLATEGNALFGIKADSRWSGKVCQKLTKEYVNGKYIDVMASFRAYDSWNDSIKDHADFLVQNKRYANLIGQRDYKTYCKLIKSDGYATSATYAETLINCIETYNLTKYDAIVGTDAVETPTVQIRSFNIHAGHNPSGMPAAGSVGYLNESYENRNVCNALIGKIRSAGHTVYDCTCNNGSSQKDILQKIVSKCNEHAVDLDISIHFNALSKETASDGRTRGVEVWIHPNNKGTEIESYAQKICNSVASLGFTNRGVKYSNGLYVLKNTKAPAMLIECCFVDDLDDYALYDCEKMVQAIYDGLEIKSVNATGEAGKDEPETKTLYYVIAGVYSSEQNATAFANILAEKGYLMNVEGNLMKGIKTQIKEI